MGLICLAGWRRRRRCTRKGRRGSSTAMEPGTRPGLWECDLKEEEEHGRSCTDADVLVLLGLATSMAGCLVSRKLSGSKR